MPEPLEIPSQDFLITGQPDILSETAFSEAERKPAESQSAQLCSSNTMRNLKEICDTMKTRIETITRQEMLSGMADASPGAGQVIFAFRLGQA